MGLSAQVMLWWTVGARTRRLQKGLQLRKSFPRSSPQGWTLGRRQFFGKVTPRKKEFGMGKELAQNDTEKGDLGPWGTGGRWGVLRVDRQRSDGGGPHAGRVGHCRGGSAMRSPDAPSSFQSEGESPRFQLLLPGPRADQLVQKAAEVCLQSPAAP